MTALTPGSVSAANSFACDGVLNASIAAAGEAGPAGGAVQGPAAVVRAAPATLHARVVAAPSASAPPSTSPMNSRRSAAASSLSLGSYSGGSASFCTPNGVPLKAVTVAVAPSNGLPGIAGAAKPNARVRPGMSGSDSEGGGIKGFLQKLDPFTKPKPDPKNKTSFGGVLVLLSPVLVALLIAFLCVQYADRPSYTTSASKVKSSSQQYTGIPVTCDTSDEPRACAVLFPSATCRAANGDVYGVIIPAGETRRITFCAEGIAVVAAPTAAVRAGYTSPSAISSPNGFCFTYDASGTPATVTVGASPGARVSIGGSAFLDLSSGMALSYGLKYDLNSANEITGVTGIPGQIISNPGREYNTASTEGRMAADFLCPGYNSAPLEAAPILRPSLTYVETTTTRPGTVTELLSGIGGAIGLVVTALTALHGVADTIQKKLSGTAEKEPDFPFPRKLDIYVSPQVNPADKSFWGGVSALLYPAAFIAMIVFLAIDFSNRPIVIENDVATARSSDSFEGTFTCVTDRFAATDPNAPSCAVMFPTAECRAANGGVAGVVVRSGVTRTLQLCASSMWVFTSMNPATSAVPGANNARVNDVVDRFCFADDAAARRIGNSQPFTYSIADSVVSTSPGQVVEVVVDQTTRLDSTKEFKFAAEQPAVAGADTLDATQIANFLCPNFMPDFTGLSLSGAYFTVAPQYFTHKETRPGTAITLLSAIGGAASLLFTVFGGLTTVLVLLFGPKKPAEPAPADQTFLARIDQFVAPKPDPNQKTHIGGVLTLLTPPAVIVVIVLLIVDFTQRPTIVTSSTEISNSTSAYPVDFTASATAAATVMFTTPECRLANNNASSVAIPRGETRTVNVCFPKVFLFGENDPTVSPPPGTLYSTPYPFCYREPFGALFRGVGGKLDVSAEGVQLARQGRTGAASRLMSADVYRKLDGTEDATIGLGATVVVGTSFSAFTPITGWDVGAAVCPSFFPAGGVPELTGILLYAPASYVLRTESRPGDASTLLSSFGGGISLVLTVLGAVNTVAGKLFGPKPDAAADDAGGAAAGTGGGSSSSPSAAATGAAAAEQPSSAAPAAASPAGGVVAIEMNANPNPSASS